MIRSAVRSGLPVRLPIALAALLWACSEPPPSPPAPVKQADLVEVEGAVTLERGDAGVARAVVGPLYLGDVLSTGAQSRAVLRARGQELELGALTRFRIGSRFRDVSLELDEGAIRFVGEADGGALVLATRYGRAVLASGASGQLGADQAGHTLRLTMGSITFLDEDGGEHTASAGQRFRLSMGAFTVLDDEPPEDAGVADAGAPPAARAVRFTPERGAALLKAPGQGVFKATTDAREVGEGTAFKLGAGVRARVETGALTVRLAPRTTGTLGKVTDSALDLELTGAASALFGEGETRLALGASTVTATHAATVAMTRSSTSFGVDVLAGEVEVSVGDQRVTAVTGQRVVTQGKNPVVKTRAKAPLVVPLDRHVRVHGALAEVGLALPDEPVRVEVARDAAFTELVVSGLAKGSLAVPRGDARALFVRTLAPDGTVTHQSTVLFRPDVATPKARGGTEVISETGQRATLYFQSEEVPALTFAFAPREGARRYRLKIFTAKDLKTPLVEREVTTPKCTLEAGVPEGSYVWYAAALASDGTELGDGATNQFEVKFDNELTSLTIARPAPGEVASASAVASGVAPLKSRLFINGQAATLDGQGRFSVPVGAVDVVVFRLVSDGTDSYWLRRLARR